MWRQEAQVTRGGDVGLGIVDVVAFVSWFGVSCMVALNVLWMGTQSRRDDGE